MELRYYSYFSILYREQEVFESNNVIVFRMFSSFLVPTILCTLPVIGFPPPSFFRRSSLRSACWSEFNTHLSPTLPSLWTRCPSFVTHGGRVPVLRTSIRLRQSALPTVPVLPPPTVLSSVVPPVLV